VSKTPDPLPASDIARLHALIGAHGAGGDRAVADLLRIPHATLIRAAAGAGIRAATAEVIRLRLAEAEGSK
jgi:hypothetical protein